MQTVVTFKTHTKQTLLGWGGCVGGVEGVEVGMEVEVGGGRGGWVGVLLATIWFLSESARNTELGVFDLPQESTGYIVEGMMIWYSTSLISL